MKAIMISLALLLLMASVSAYHTYDYSKSGYGVAGTMNAMVEQGVKIGKSMEGYGALQKTDFRKSMMRPTTYVKLGPQSDVNIQLGGIGAGQYTNYKYDYITDAMMVKPIDPRSRGGPNPYFGIYGVERQAIKPYNVPEQNFGTGTSGGYINPGIPKMIRTTSQYVSAGLPAYVEEGAAPAAAQ
jgi:hypothetical protein